MIRKACIVTALALAASTVVACSSGDVAVGKSQAQQLKTKSDGSPTGNGATCSLDGVVWGGTGGGSGTTGSGATDPGTTGSAPPAPTTATYAVGATFPSPDGCNTCKCESDGVWCTVQACGGGTPPPAPPPGSGCDVGGKHYDEGAAIPSDDGCNTCTCHNGSASLCTMKACFNGCLYDGKTYAVGAGFKSSDGCNSCSCQPDGNVVCTAMACAPAP